MRKGTAITPQTAVSLTKMAPVSSAVVAMIFISLILQCCHALSNLNNTIVLLQDSNSERKPSGPAVYCAAISFIPFTGELY